MTPIHNVNQGAGQLSHRDSWRAVTWTLVNAEDGRVHILNRTLTHCKQPTLSVVGEVTVDKGKVTRLLTGYTDGCMDCAVAITTIKRNRRGRYGE